MTTNILSGIVQVVSGKHSGTGFVVSEDGLIVTCAHVLGPSMPEQARVVFQTTGGSEEREAVVIGEAWRAVDSEDVAVLRVTEALPVGAHALPLGSSQGTEGHSLVAFGYPETGEVEGVRATGIILGKGARTRAGQLLLQLRSSEITAGFSGAPIWDEVRQRVVGIVVIVAESDVLGKLGETAFAIPTETLRAVYPALQVSDLCPYRSLEAFTEADAAFFFGREWIIDEFISSLKKELRFLAIFGPSGCGKSSLVQAGLIPRLRAGAVPGSDHWAILVTRPTDPTFRDLLTGLKALEPSTAIVIDQFEELFVAFSDPACSASVTEVTRLLETAPSVTFIIVMRNDFYNRFVQHETLVPWLSRGLVNVSHNIRRYELATIVKEPAVLAGIRCEDGLVETIVTDALSTTFKESKDVGSSTVLPLLEFALTQLWERRQENMLTHQAYEQIGGVTGSLTQWANHAYYRFEEKQRPLVRYLFTALVHLDDEAHHIHDTRRRRDLSSLIGNEEERTEVYEVMQRLVASRLIVMSQDTESKQETIEIIHDALLWEWGLLKQWLEEDRKFLLWHQELERRVRAWIETNRYDPTKRDVYKLFGGFDLSEAFEWMETRSRDLSQSEREFIQASRERQERGVYTRRWVLVGLVGLGLGLTGTTFIVTKLLSPGKVPSAGTQNLPLPYTYRGHTAPVITVAWSPDGKRIASASSDKTVRVWDTSIGKTLLIYTGHTNPVNSVAWSPDGKRIASASYDGIVQVWDTNTGKTLLTYLSHTVEVRSVAWSPDGKRIVSASAGGTVLTWDASTARTLLTYQGHETNDVNGVAWSPDGKRIASASSDKTVQVWNANTGSTLLTYQGHTNPVNSVVWSPDGTRLASASSDKTAQVWEATSGTILLTYRGHTYSVNRVAWSPDGKRLASASDDGTAQVWNAANGSTLLIYQGHMLNSVKDVAWAPDGTRIASASDDETVQVWNADTRHILFIFRGDASPLDSLAWAPDGTRIVSAGYDRTVQMLDASTGKILLTYQGHSTRVNSVAWASDSKRVASASDDGTVQVWDASTGKTLLTYRDHTLSVQAAAWAPDGKRIASTGGLGLTIQVQIWDASTGRIILTYMGHDDPVTRVAWSPDGKRIASAGYNRTILVWDASTGRTILTYTGHVSSVTSIAWAPDGKHIASASSDHTVQVWDVSTRKILLTYQGHTNSVNSVAWAPNGRRIASASSDQTVQVWNADAGNNIFTYQGHTNSVNSVAWAPNGRRIASASDDGTVQVWFVLQS